MSIRRTNERGEGKLNCLITLLVVGGLIAAVLKAFPVYYSNIELLDTCDLMASQGSRLPADQVEGNIKIKARELEIPEALKPGAIVVRKSGTGDSGNCSITLRYTRSIDFYGLYTYKLETNKTITKVIYTNI